MWSISAANAKLREGLARTDGNQSLRSQSGTECHFWTSIMGDLPQSMAPEGQKSSDCSLTWE